MNNDFKKVEWQEIELTLTNLITAVRFKICTEERAIQALEEYLYKRLNGLNRARMMIDHIIEGKYQHEKD